MKRVLVPYDGSENSDRALRFAIDPSAGAGAREVHLLNVQDWPALYGDYMTAQDFRDCRERQIAHGRELLAPATRILAASKLPFQAHVLTGSAEHAIADQANKLCCDQIVMGTRGLGALQGMVVGSVANKVIHLAQVPVTLVK